MAKRTGRQRNQLPNCYYEGYLEKTSFKDKTSRKLWTCLCGNTLFFFNEKRDTDYLEKLDLSELISITDDGSQDRNLGAARLNLQMKDGNIEFTVPNAEARELWKGYIHSVVKLSLPSSLNLLPGQIHMLKEAVEREKERTKTATNSSLYISLQADMPACYHSVSRLEAEMLLEREARRGNLLLRPGRDGNSFAVTTRQDHNGSIFRHYRVVRKHDGCFAIDVDNPVPCATLCDAINYLVEKTDGVLIPLIIEEKYETNILAPRIPTPEPVPALEEGNLYLNDMLETEKEPVDPPAVPLPQVEKKPPKKAMMPPTPALRKRSSSTSPPSSASSTNSQDPRMRVHVDTLGQIPLTAIAELKLKLEQKVRCQE
ncbi:signal-transducing adaptor protein 1-like isoform X2 [Siniperca chuatsi]|uniref:signal-transducing adaptor protein 1-like isoform X2 n=1 Tax=Siniperca chuatsi TaxID=119488 RepID=UPI001CE03995|nr:signal-transducing adaptor protein 1-like isoform X2 [Siniperca chuatsi]